MAGAESEPLLKPGGDVAHGDEWAQGQVKQWAQWAQYVVPSARDGPVEVEPEEIRDAAAHDPYPQWIYGALVTPENDRVLESGAGEHIPTARQQYLPPDVLSSVQGLPEEEIREILVDHVDHQCCWGRRPASKWNMKKVEDCNAFIGALESFIEEREVYASVEPYKGQPVTTMADKDARILGPWEVDVRDEFPLLFTLKKEAHTIIPFSQSVEVCNNCSGTKEVPCTACHKSDENGKFHKSSLCKACYGRGLIAHKDGSDTNCNQCRGTGSLECNQCGSRGLVKCSVCAGSGSLVHSQVLLTRWRTIITKKVSASSHAATLPDDVFHEASGIQLHSNQAHSCQPVKFPSSLGLTKLSADLFATREQVPPTARLIVERHQLRVIPVTRVVMSEGDRSFKFYIVGLEKNIFLKDYPSTCALCCCLQMFSVY